MEHQLMFRHRQPRCKADTTHYPRYMRDLKEERRAMTDTIRYDALPVHEGLDARRKKLRFRSWHRGMREMDLILGRFADREMASLTDDEIDQYERLLDIPDTEFLPVVTGEKQASADVDCPVLQKILASRHSMKF